MIITDESALDKAKTCCFTGHRPDKLNLPEDKLKALLSARIERLAGDGYDTFISGMARGVDIYAAEAVLELRRRLTDIRLVCAVPFAGSCESFAEPWRQRAARILNDADYRIDVCPSYRPECFHMRNAWMLRHSSYLIAVFNGTQGGTYSTILTAQRMGIYTEIIMID